MVTSLTGAALQDIRVTLKRRFPAANLVIYPSLVQGEQAPRSVCKAIQTAGDRNEVDILIVARGGGALEDLHAFNDESVARAIFDCQIPIVSGVGHETDFTIADMVADARAATPTAAAEMVTPDGAKMLRECGYLRRRLIDTTHRLINQHRQSVDYACGKLVHPTQRLDTYRQQQKSLNKALLASIQLSLVQASNAIGRAHISLAAHSPVSLVSSRRQQMNSNRTALFRQMSFAIKNRHLELRLRRSQLTLVGPMQTLERGYAILQTSQGQVISGIQQLKSGHHVKATLHDGQAQLLVDDASSESR